MKSKYYIIIAFMLMLFPMKAQTVKWSLTPKYDNITYYSEDVFKCMIGDKIQLCDCNGKEYLPSPVDSVTNYEGGYALALNREGAKLAVIGFFSEKKGHTFQQVIGEYYIAKYSFFSEGYLAVADKDGKVGYLNSMGQLSISCQYIDARPFRKGYASVVVKKRKDGLNDVCYINQNGKTNGPVGFSSHLTYGTTFDEEGLAVVGDHSKFAVVNNKFNVVRSTSKPNKGSVSSFDYSLVNDGEECVRPNTNKLPEMDGSCQIQSQNGLYGYVSRTGEVVAPPQFSDVYQFANGYAIAAVGGKYGILELLQGRFEPSWPKSPIKVYYGLKCAPQNFSLQVPSALGQVLLDFDGGNGMERMESLEFSFKPLIEQNASTCNLKAKVTSKDGLLLWEGSQGLDLRYVNISVSKPVVTSVYADENDNQVVKATVTNNSKVSVKVNATLKVSGKNNSFNETLAPGQSKSLTVVVKVTQEKNGKSENASVSVKVDDKFEVPGSSSNVKFQLI